MENNNDNFVQKFNYTKRSHSSITTTVIASFVSAIVGGACALRNLYKFC